MRVFIIFDDSIVLLLAYSMLIERTCSSSRKQYMYFEFGSNLVGFLVFKITIFAIDFRCCVCRVFVAIRYLIRIWSGLGFGFLNKSGCNSQLWHQSSDERYCERINVLYSDKVVTWLLLFLSNYYYFFRILSKCYYFFRIFYQNIIIYQKYLK